MKWSVGVCASKAAVGVLMLSLICLISPAAAKADKKDLQCAACLVLADEINDEIKKADPKQKIQVGSFRLDGNGNQGLREVPFARSEVHLTEVLEAVCQHMPEYGQSKDSKGRTTFFRAHNPTGVPLSKKNMEVGSHIRKRVELLCSAIIEDHEDEIVKLYKDEGVKDAESVLCVETLELCDASAIMDRMMAQGQALMAGMEEQKEAEAEQKAQAEREAEAERAAAEAKEEEEDGEDEDQTEEEVNEEKDEL